MLSEHREYQGRLGTPAPPVCVSRARVRGDLAAAFAENPVPNRVVNCKYKFLIVCTRDWMSTAARPVFLNCLSRGASECFQFVCPARPLGTLDRRARSRSILRMRTLTSWIVAAARERPTCKFELFNERINAINFIIAAFQLPPNLFPVFPTRLRGCTTQRTPCTYSKFPSPARESPS